jgi:Rrf2 family transcriptional regulator, iron-sulfur cluster assembly transcription factor
MLYSKYCEYVIKALSYLSLYGTGDRYVMVREISENTNIPFYFLSKIFQDLVSKNWVNSKKGKKGGFTMAIDSSKLTLLDVITWSDGIHNFSKCILGDKECGSEFKCDLHNKCSFLRNEITDFFDAMTIKDVAEINRQHAFAHKSDVLNN